MRHPYYTQRSGATLALLLIGAFLLTGCAQCRIPAFDPTGNYIFSGETTSLNVPNPLAAVPRPAYQSPASPPPCPPANAAAPPCGNVPGSVLPAMRLDKGSYVVVVPGRVVAPVGSEVIVASGICGDNGSYVMRQPLEWVLTPDSVGHIVEVGKNEHSFLHAFFHREETKKVTPDFAKTRTHSHRQTITRGTSNPADDVSLGKGQSWVSVTSPTEGASFVSVVAPSEENWDRRRQTATVYWVDAQWLFPSPAISRLDDRRPVDLNTVVTRTGVGGPIQGWIVRYDVLSGPTATFVENGLTSIEATTDVQGQARAQLNPSGQPGITQVGVQIIRPASGRGEYPRMIIGQGQTTVTWSAPGLNVNVSGPPRADADTETSYRTLVSNTGDLAVNDVTLSYTVPDGTTLVSTNPPAQHFGDRLEWRLGSIAQGAEPRVVEVTLRMALEAEYQHCFKARTADGLVNEACARTTVDRSPLRVRMTGPAGGQVAVGSQAKFLVDIINDSGLPLRNVQLTDYFGEGLRHSEGFPSPLKSPPIETLAPGETKKRAITFIVQSPGEQRHELRVSADGVPEVTLQGRVAGVASTGATKPRITLLGPKSLEENESGTFDLEVTNDGTAPLTGLTVRIRMPSNLRATRVTAGRKVGSNDEIYWQEARIDPSETSRYEIQFVADRATPGATTLAYVETDQGAAQTEYTTEVLPLRPLPDSSARSNEPRDPEREPRVPDREPPPREREQPRGVAPPVDALQLKITDSSDPAVVGESYRYTVTVENKSDVSVRNVSIQINVPRELQIEQPRIGGGTRIQIAKRGTRVIVGPIAELRAGDRIGRIEIPVIAREAGTYEVTVNATGADGVTSSAFQETNVESAN